VIRTTSRSESESSAMRTRGRVATFGVVRLASTVTRSDSTESPLFPIHAPEGARSSVSL